MRNSFERGKIEYPDQEKEYKECIEKLGNFIKEIAESLRTEGVPVDDDCRIDMDAFKDIYKMPNPFVELLKLPEAPLWQKIKNERQLVSFDLEITARCNNNCGHCYINLPADDKTARKKELSFSEIKHVVD